MTVCLSSCHGLIMIGLAPVDSVRPPVDLLRPHAAEEMKAWKVDKAVGNVRNVGPELCMEWSGPSDILFA
jgi:hypothetical protein